MSDEQAVKVGDRFLRAKAGGEWTGDEVGLVADVDKRPHEMTIRGIGEYSWFADAPTVDEIASGDWRRVPPGYVVPPIGDLLAGIVGLVLAYRAMLADPETGAKGIDTTVREMARLGGIEVTW